jgi:ribosomal-protein-alanine N-acetyltransferase
MLKGPLPEGPGTVPSLAAREVPPTASAAGWRVALPVFSGPTVTVRELRTSDAAALLAALSPEHVSRYIAPPPATLEDFERFIGWSKEQRAAGRRVCFGVVPHGLEAAVGLIQLRALAPDFSVAEWEFALGSEFWGTGTFVDGARHALAFGFNSVGIARLEARAAVANGRGNGALLKLGAVRECVLRRSFLRSGERHDQGLWSILREQWEYTAAPGADHPGPFVN